MLAKVEMQSLASIDEAKEYMLGSFKQFSSIVRSTETAKRYFGIAIHCLEQVPRLMECPRSSFRNALLESARLDLEPNSVQQHCWIVPRAERKGGRPIARLEVGYRGLAQLVFRDGAVLKVWAMAVDEKDEFRREEGTEQVLVHKLANKHSDGSVETMVAAYACAKLASGEVMYRVMDREKLEAARELSKSSAYNGPFAMEMYLKTPLKRLCKTLPLKSREIQRAVADAVSLEDKHENIVPDPGEGLGTPPAQTPQVMDTVELVNKTVERIYGKPAKETALPQETREEVKARIKRTWEYLLKLKKEPRLQQKPIEYYVGESVELGEMRGFADYLSREMLKAEREQKQDR